MLLIGLTVKLVFDVIFPGFKVYVFAPEGVITTDAPGQMLLLLAEVKPIVGEGMIVTVVDAVLLHPVLLSLTVKL